MTKDNDMDNLFVDLSCDDSQQQQKPFQIVLVDIEKAVVAREIVCVEKPLMGDEDLKFVALSYRWGELPETIIDTELGYLATITSFTLDDFFSLCVMLSSERDLKSIKYVWVDAICVNQTNPVKRKATIYQMSNIYERANYIVAVPDLHLTYLRNATTKNRDIIAGSEKYSDYIYHLIHGCTDQLITLDEKWFDQFSVPKDLRQVLPKCPLQFGTDVIKYHVYGPYYDSKNALDHIQDAIISSYTPAPKGSGQEKCSHEKSGVDYGYDNNIMPHHPLKSDKNKTLDYDWLIKEMTHNYWKQLMSKRSSTIQQSMDFLADLIKDWSSRVWVISEYIIAKNKKTKKMKYWFVQLNVPGRLFFEFDFGGTCVSTSKQDENCIFKNASSYHALTAKSDDLYQKLLKTMAAQLNRQTLFEMMLKSNASKHEDRLYAILPFSKYSEKIAMVDSCKFDSLLSVKLKLLEWMDTMDKLELLFLSGIYSNTKVILPSFATTNIIWPRSDEYPILENDNFECNFDLTDKTAIMLIQPSPTIKNDDVDPLCMLNLKPKEYFRRAPRWNYNFFQRHNKVLLSSFGLDGCDNILYGVCICSYCGTEFKRYDDRDGSRIYLIGSFEKNKWMIVNAISFAIYGDDKQEWEHFHTNDDFDGFNIY